MYPKKLFAVLFIGLGIFVLLILYNYLGAQKAVRESHPSTFAISFGNTPSTISKNERGNFSWKIDAPPDLYSSTTGIYYGPNSSPSALLQTDSPDAVRYPSFTPDYSVGSFKLPGLYDVNISFGQSGKIFFRAYSKVGKLHLWTEERSLTIIDK